jgi:hypothetical protein
MKKIRKIAKTIIFCLEFFLRKCFFENIAKNFLDKCYTNSCGMSHLISRDVTLRNFFGCCWGSWSNCDFSGLRAWRIVFLTLLWRIIFGHSRWDDTISPIMWSWQLNVTVLPYSEPLVQVVPCINNFFTVHVTWLVQLKGPC